MRMILQMELLTYWHAGSGRGEGEQADAVVIRSSGGLPYLPGRSLKGLLRDAAELGAACGLLSDADVTNWFGSDLMQAGADGRTRQLEEARFRTEPGTLRFSSATLGPDWEAWARTAPEELSPLFARLATTSIDRAGVAKDRTLRTLEVAVPMTLRASVEGPGGSWKEGLRQVLPLVRSLGTGRNRGLGRVDVQELR